jgi:hypothetical protein
MKRIDKEVVFHFLTEKTFSKACHLIKNGMASPFRLTIDHYVSERTVCVSFEFEDTTKVRYVIGDIDIITLTQWFINEDYSFNEIEKAYACPFYNTNLRNLAYEYYMSYFESKNLKAAIIITNQEESDAFCF